MDKQCTFTPEVVELLATTLNFLCKNAISCPLRVEPCPFPKQPYCNPGIAAWEDYLNGHMEDYPNAKD